MTTDDRIKVLHLLPPSIGGTRTHVMGLLEHLDRRRFDISLAAPSEMRGAFCSERLAGAQFEALELAEKAEPLGLMYSSMHLAGLVRRLKTRILHSHGIRAMLASGIGGRVAPVRVTTLHHPFLNALSPAARPMVAYGFKTQTHFVTPSAVIKAELQALGVERERITVIPHGMLATRPQPAEVEAAARGAGLPPDMPLVVMPSRYSMTSAADLIAAVGAIVRRGECTVAFTGRDPDTAGFGSFQRGCDPDRVFFCGYVQDLRPLLCGARVVAMPAPGRGTPLTALEAMACGKALVTTAGGELAETIVDGVNGRIVPPDDPEALADAVVDLLQHPAEAERIGAAAREHVLEAFSADVMIRKLEALYVDLLESAQGSTEGATA